MAANQTLGNIGYTVGATEPFFVQIYQKDGITPEPIPNITELTLNLRNLLTGAVIQITSPKVTIDDADLGKIKISLAEDEFTNIDAKYFYHFSFTDDAGKKIKVPTDTERYIFEVFRNHES